MRKISDTLVLLLTVMAGAAQPFAPVNPHASAEGKRVLSYLYSVSGKYILFLLTGNTTQRVKDVYARPETLSHQDVKIP